MKIIFTFLIIICILLGFSRKAEAQDCMQIKTQPFSHLIINGEGGVADSAGVYQYCTASTSKFLLVIQALGYRTFRDSVLYQPGSQMYFPLLTRTFEANAVQIEDVRSRVSRDSTPIGIQRFDANYLTSGGAVNAFEMIALVPGVQPQTTCTVCGAGEFRLNGMDGPYTMVCIDGVPIMSQLSAVYGLSGIPASMVERIEVQKGPSEVVYGAEACAGVINIITRKGQDAPLTGMSLQFNSYAEINGDLSFGFKSRVADVLTGVSGFYAGLRIDRNSDGFMDIVQLKRLNALTSISWKGKRRMNAGSTFIRYQYEDRTGGQMNFDHSMRGGDSIYGENILLHRIEAISEYRLPVKPDIRFQGSWNTHFQDAYYGTMHYKGIQHSAFFQGIYRHMFKWMNLETGLSFRSMYYDDNTVITLSADSVNTPFIRHMPGIFSSQLWKISKRHQLQTGYRLDYDSRHGFIFTPRINYLTRPSETGVFRMQAGTGYRVVTVFAEEHAALTGARTVVIDPGLKPERSIQLQSVYTHTFPYSSGYAELEFSGFGGYFYSGITADYESDPQYIFFRNIRGFKLNSGATFSVNIQDKSGFRMNLSVQGLYSARREDGSFIRQLYTPFFNGNWNIAYNFRRAETTVEFTGLLNGPARMPVQPGDARSEYSPWTPILNLRVLKTFGDHFTCFIGVQNLLDIFPKQPILRAFDPFDKQINNPVSNPYGQTFDTGYSYSPMTGIRMFGGFSLVIDRHNVKSSKPGR